MAIDLFADADLSELGPTRRIAFDRYPTGLEALATTMPSCPWLYTGALENHPGLIDRIAAHRPLWGNPGRVLTAVRDPFVWTDVLQRAGLPCPAVRQTRHTLPRDRPWLVKPLASGGGTGIFPFDSPSPAPGKSVFYQERIDGLSLSAIFVGRPDITTLAGVTRQLLGRPGAEFAYVGSLGPWPLPSIETARIQRLGELLAGSFELRGLFGVDFILHDGHPWPVEINPRYTASIEVLELAQGQSWLAQHRAVFDPTAPTTDAIATPAHSQRVVGKRILFAIGDSTFPNAVRPRPASRDRYALPTLADRPQPGTHFEHGEPIATVFEAAEDPETCLARLERRCARWEQRVLTPGTEQTFTGRIPPRN